MPMNIFSVSSNQQDVQVLLDDVAEALRQWEAGEAPGLDLSIMLGETGKVSQQANRLKGGWNVDGSAIIQSTRPGLGPWIIRFQRLVRRLTWWYVEPILQQIRSFQRDTALTADGLAQNQEHLLARYEALQERLEALEDRFSEADGDTGGDAQT
jgi:hypothetical protein